MMVPIAYLGYLQVRQAYVQHEMKEKLESSLLQTIILNPDEIHWVKSGKEIRIGKQLFDVKTYSIKNGKAYFTGLYDHEERLIEKQFSHFGDHHSKKDSLTLSKLFSLLQSVFFSNVTGFDYVIKFMSSYPSSYNSALPKIFKVIPTPPPQQ